MEPLIMPTWLIVANLGLWTIAMAFIAHDIIESRRRVYKLKILMINKMSSFDESELPTRIEYTVSCQIKEDFVAPPRMVYKIFQDSHPFTNDVREISTTLKAWHFI